MSVELALGPFLGPWLPTSPGKPNACELHAGGFDFTAVRFRVFCPLEALS